MALIVSAIVLAQSFRTNAERSFQALLLAHAYNVMGALERDEAGRLTGMPDLRDPRFQTPLSGWSWSASDEQDRIASPSLARGRLILPDEPFDDRFQRLVQGTDALGRDLLVLEAQLLVDEGDRPVTVQIAGATDGIETQVASLRARLVLFFAFFGLGLLLVTAIVLRIGLRPLARARDQLAAIRDGTRETLDGDQPREIQPLVDEVNALLVSNREVVERSRRQVGNLAHGLKTPLTVLRNEAGSENTPLATVVSEQTEAMRLQIDTYLDRARIAAVRQTARARAPVGPIVDGLLRTIRKLAPGLVVELVEPIDPTLAFAGDASDLQEMLGNLLENASRFASSRVVVSARIEDEHLVITIDDDGTGLTSDEMENAMSRGVRLDERRSGSGLGLSIVAEITEAYDGAFALELSPLGGLRARLALPYANVAPPPGRSVEGDAS